MLQLVLGTAGTGKTGLVLARMKARAAAGKKSVLLVPEQFSSSAESMVYAALGDSLGAHAEVYSFKSYAEKVLKTHGGVAVATLSDAARTVAVRRAMDSLGDAVQLYRRHRRGVRFCNLCAQAIEELKTAGAAPQDLVAIGEAEGADGEKLRELGLVFAAYEKVIEKSAMDPSDRLLLAARSLPAEELAGTAVFLDDFDGFTQPQYALLDAFLQAESCTVALCCDGLADAEDGLGLFSPVKRTAARLLRAARRLGVPVEKPKLLQKDLRHAGAPGLAAAVAAVGGTGAPPAPLAGEVWFTPAPTLHEECRAAACRAAALAREGVAYGDMAFICRDMQQYSAPLLSALSLAGVPVFRDESLTLEHSAVASFFLAALELAARGISTERVLRLLKTELCSLSPGDIALLENYAYTWQLKAADWRAPFEKSPAGFGAQPSPQQAQELARTEALRAGIMEKLGAFLQSVRGATAAGISRALYFLLDSFGGAACTEALAAQLAAAGDAQGAAAVYDAWNHVMQLLDEMEKLLGGDETSPGEYAELFALLLRGGEMGRVPQTQEAAIFTQADRMRLSGPRVCFVLGLSEGEFPRAAGASGLLTHTDRELLVRRGVQMPGSYENRTLLEQMYFYRALAAPRGRLYLSCTAAGDAQPCAALAPVLALGPERDELSFVQLAPTPAAALQLYSEQYGQKTPFTAALRAALEARPGLGPVLAAMDEAASPQPFHAADKKALEQLLGTQLTLSPTRVEQYYRCRFSYFLQYVLHILPRRKAELSPLESGSLVHYILEHALRRAGACFAELSREELTALADGIADEYVRQNMPAAGARFAHLIARLKRAVANLLFYLQSEQAQSSFHPVAFEQAIGGSEAGAVPPLELKTPDGKAVRVVGKIDRVDVMRRGGETYLRVVDYKTGTKKFSLEDVYCGLNTQMLFYLFTLCHAPQGQYAGARAAGVLYLLSDPAPKTAARAGAEKTPLYEVDGLVVNDPVIVRGMDKDATGVFVPFGYSKNGTPRASAKLASLEKLGNIERHITGLVLQMAQGLYSGDIAAQPLRAGGHCPCDVCDYRPVCRHEDGKDEACAAAPKDVFEPKAGEVTGP